jgi:hypothetical protein
MYIYIRIYDLLFIYYYILCFGNKVMHSTTLMTVQFFLISLSFLSSIITFKEKLKKKKKKNLEFLWVLKAFLKFKSFQLIVLNF